MKLFASLLLLLSCAALAEPGELTNEDVIRELNEGAGYKADRFIFNVKPVSFIFGQAIAEDLPYPMKCVQVKARLYQNLGIQAEPIFVLAGDGGFGFTVGPSYFPSFPWEDWHLGPKYEFEYINKMGAYHGFMLELDRHRLFGNFVLTYGGAFGFAVNGATGSTDSEGNTRVFEITQGLTYDINLGLGFAL
jgi:hypothetical protein